MRTHVLDTGAVLVLLNKHRSALEHKLRDIAGEAIWIPVPVLVELGQASAPPKRRMEAILGYADIADLPEQRRLAQRAAEALRAAKRAKCDNCQGFSGPSIVDALVMAFAAEYAANDETIVYHQDTNDLETLKREFFKLDNLKLERA